MTADAAQPAAQASTTPKLDELDPALRHILVTLLRAKEGDLLVEALRQNNMRDVECIIPLHFDFDPNFLEIPSTGARNAPVTKVPLIHISRILQLNQIAEKHFDTHGTRMQDDDWLAMDISAYRTALESVPKLPTTTPRPTPRAASNATTPATAPSASPYTKAALFKRGIKRDPAAFPVLKQQKYYQLWKRTFMAQARAQDVSNVTDEKYNPTAQEDKDPQ